MGHRNQDGQSNTDVGADAWNELACQPSEQAQGQPVLNAQHRKQG